MTHAYARVFVYSRATKEIRDKTKGTLLLIIFQILCVLAFTRVRNVSFLKQILYRVIFHVFFFE